MAIDSSPNAENAGTIEQKTRPMRPSFSSALTSDRLSEAARRPSIVITKSPSNGERRSVFKEVGLLEEEEAVVLTPTSSESIPAVRPRFNAAVTSDRLDEAARRPSIHSKSSTESSSRKSVFVEVGLDEDASSGSTSLLAEPTKLPRPRFNSAVTSDRLEEAERRPSVYSQKSCDSGSRKSVFKEIGLETDYIADEMAPTPVDGPGDLSQLDASGQYSKEKTDALNLKLSKASMIPHSKGKSNTSTPPQSFLSFSRLAMIVLLIALVVPGLRLRSRTNVPLAGADAGVVKGRMEPRADSPTTVCTRWSQQSALINGTVYIYGGQTKTSSSQTTNTWNNDFLTLDLTTTWNIASPPLAGLEQPDGPPSVASGYLWNSFTSLFLYGGEFADNPFTEPLPVSTWEYSLISSTWIEHASPTTTAGNNSDANDWPVQRAAEGAGLSVPELGLSWYFGGHLDLSTTQGWSNQIARVYLKSMLEFTHPGFMNTGVQGLGVGGGAAGSDGAYRNITEGGLQAEAGFTERADGVLVYVPGWGESGILLGLAGGTNITFTEMNEIDVYDIANSIWYKQATSGTTPSIRVDPCATVFAAADGSSFQVMLYGGQNLQPYDDQTQYSDIWILTIPSFTWISVDLDGQSQPAARAGHTCHAWDGQMIVIGGYVGTEISCDPGFFVFNASSLQWQSNFASLSGKQSDDGETTSGLSGSNGYVVPAAVQSIVGGDSSGGATVTTPAAGAATSGPIATGHPPTFTVTQSGTTVTAHPTTTPTSGSSSTPIASASKKTRNVGAIAAGAIAGALAIIAAYLAFCTWLYRRQLAMYKNHVAVSQRASLAYGGGLDAQKLREKGTAPLFGAFGTDISHSNSNAGARDSGGSSIAARESVLNGMAPVRYASIADEHEPTEYQGGAPSLVGADTNGGRWERGSNANSSTEDLLAGQEMSFINVVMSPRRTLRVINKD